MTSSYEQGGVLTREMLDEAIKAIREKDRAVAEHEAKKGQAWADLCLDYDSMTAEERHWIAYAQAALVMNPRDAERVRVIVEKYRRDRRW